MVNTLQFAPLPEDKETETNTLVPTSPTINFAPGKVQEKLNFFEDSIYFLITPKSVV